MRSLFTGLIVILVLVIGVLLIAPMFLPKDLIKTQVTQAVADQTGRELRIGGDVALALFPTAKLKAADVEFANAPGGRAENMASMGSLDVGLALLPLLTGHVQIKSFVLTEPVINLEVDKNGKANWEFETAPPADDTPTQAEEPSDAPSGTQGPALGDVTFGDVRIVNGQLSYLNAQTGDDYQLSDINTSIKLPSLDRALELDGSAVYNEEKITVALDASKARALLQGGETALNARIDSNLIKFEFKGDADFAEKMALTGTTGLDIPSVKTLAAWAGTPIEGADDGPGFERAALTGTVNATGSTYTFENAKLVFDQIEATGAVTADLGGAVPNISGSLKTPMLDLRPYTGTSADAPSTSDTRSNQAGSNSWSKEPMDVSALKSFDALLTFDAGGIKVQDMSIGQSEVTLKVAQGVLTATLGKMALYQGAGNGKIVIDGSRTTPKVSSNLSLSGLALAPFLQDAAQTDRFEGTGQLSLNLTGAGASQYDIIKSLAGSANIDFADGAIKGIDLNQVASIVNSLTGKKAEEGDTASASGGDNKTKFVSLGGDFAIKNGIVNTGNLKMINELISVSGSGNINLPKQTLDLRLDPGQSQDDGGLKVALKVTGSWDNPKVAPDASALIQNELEEVFGDSDAGSVLQSILGGGKKDLSDSDGANDNASDNPAESLLNNLLKK